MYKLAALALFAAALTSTYEARVKSLAAEAEAQRKKLGLDSSEARAKLYAQFPTPEVTFQGDPPRLSCGETATIRLTGNWPKGTAFLFNDDDVQVVEEKPGAGSWQAKIRVAEQAAPAIVAVHAVAPVSGARISSRALTIRARYDIDLSAEDGWSAHFATERADAGSGELLGTIEWNKGTEKRQLRAEIDTSNGPFRLRTAPTEEEMKIAQEEVEQLRGMGGDEYMRNAMARIEECMKKEEPARSACAQEAQKKTEQEAKEMKQKVDAAQAKIAAKRPTAAWSCHEITLRASAGALAGKGRCANDKTQKISGSLHCTGAIKED